MPGKNKSTPLTPQEAAQQGAAQKTSTRGWSGRSTMEHPAHEQARKDLRVYLRELIRTGGFPNWKWCSEHWLPQYGIHVQKTVLQRWASADPECQRYLKFLRGETDDPELLKLAKEAHSHD